MTTIAFRDGILAADTLMVSATSMRSGYGSKIFRAGDVLLALTGFAPTAFALRDWYLCEPKKRQQMPDFERVGSMVVFGKSEIVVYCQGASQPEAKAEFYAYGSGQDIALGAMAMGASAADAVSIAARFCIYTGGHIETLEL